MKNQSEEKALLEIQWYLLGARMNQTFASLDEGPQPAANNSVVSSRFDALLAAREWVGDELVAAMEGNDAV